MSLVQDLQAVLEVACDKFGYIHAEALVPSEDGAVLVQSGASVCKTVGANDFRVASSSFCMPPNVCIPGRVWRTRTPEWHKDISCFSPAVFLRGEIARLVGLKGCACVPLISLESSKVLAVVAFYEGHATTVEEMPKQPLLECINRALFDGHVPSEIATFRADPLPMGAPESAGWRGSGADGEDVGDIVGGGEEEAKSWQACKQVLCMHHSERDKEATGTVLKFSKRLPLFKYITNTQRTALCSTMEILSFARGQVTHRLEQPEDGVWLVVVSGSLSLMVRTCAGGEYVRMACFGVGETFGHSYLKLFCGRDDEMTGYIECDSDGTECVRVTVPAQFRNDFRTCSRPLWYDEMATCFHVSVDQAAEQLGICMSVIKKICRRHGITRWPHRKLQSANKSLINLKAKIAKCSPTDVSQRNSLVSEAATVLTTKLRLTANPAFLLQPGSGPPQGQVAHRPPLHPKGHSGAASAEAISESPEGNEEVAEVGSKKRKRGDTAVKASKAPKSPKSPRSPKKAANSISFDADRAPSSSSSSSSSVSSTVGESLGGAVSAARGVGSGVKRGAAKGGGKAQSVDGLGVGGTQGGRGVAGQKLMHHALGNNSTKGLEGKLGIAARLPRADGSLGRSAARLPQEADWSVPGFHSPGFDDHGVVSIGSTPYSSLDPIDGVRGHDMAAAGGLEGWGHEVAAPPHWVCPETGARLPSSMPSSVPSSMPATPQLYHLSSRGTSPGFSLLPSPPMSPNCAHQGASSSSMAAFWL